MSEVSYASIICSYAPYGNLPKRIPISLGHFNIPSPISGFPHRYKEINCNPRMDFQTSRRRNRLPENDTELSQRKSEKVANTMQGLLKQGNS